MLLDLRYRDALIRVCGQDAADQVLCFRREEIWHVKISGENLLVQITRVGVFKRKVSCE